MEFRFKRFSIEQNLAVFKFGTDAALIATWADISKAKNILEIGTGTGVITLMMAQRNSRPHYIGIDISSDAVALAKKNLVNYPLPNKIIFLQTRLQKFEPNCTYDLIVSNPPFFENSTKSQSDVNLTARHTDTLSLRELLFHGCRMLSENGKFQFIYPSRYLDQVKGFAKEFRLHVTETIFIRSKKNKEIKRVIITLKKNPAILIEKELIIEADHREYSTEVNLMFKDFYLKL